MNIGEAALAAIGDLFGDDDLFPLQDYKAAPGTDRGRHLRMAALERKHGSPRAAAAAVGVTPGTWRTWAGTLKRLPRKLGALLRAHDDLLQTKRRGRIRHALRNATAHVCGVIYWGAGEERDPKYLNAKEDGPDSERGWRCTWLGHGDHKINLSRLVIPWENDDPEAAADLLSDAMLTSEGADVLIDGDNVTMEIHL